VGTVAEQDTAPRPADLDLLDIGPYRVQLEAALAYAGGTHTVADVEDAIMRGDAQLWPAPHSCIVTEIDRQPRQSILVFWIAAGVSAELEAMEPLVIAWGREQGCTKARMAGRKGWERSFLTDLGWARSGLIIMEKEL
jgi:hypothetical protein